MTNAPLIAGSRSRVFTVDTPETPLRDSARQLVRQALTKTLADMLSVEEAAISLHSVPGQPIRLAAPWQEIGISVSHEPGLSLAAVHGAGAVGVDLMRIGPTFADIDVLARDYLGPEVALALAALPGTQRQLTFARAWTRLEAGLKCLGFALSEWTPELGQQLARCTITNLDMPTGWAAALAHSTTLRLAAPTGQRGAVRGK